MSDAGPEARTAPAEGRTHATDAADAPNTEPEPEGAKASGAHTSPGHAPAGGSRPVLRAKSGSSLSVFSGEGGSMRKRADPSGTTPGGAAPGGAGRASAGSGGAGRPSARARIMRIVRFKGASRASIAPGAGGGAHRRRSFDDPLSESGPRVSELKGLVGALLSASAERPAVIGQRSALGVMQFEQMRHLEEPFAARHKAEAGGAARATLAACAALFLALLAWGVADGCQPGRACFAEPDLSVAVALDALGALGCAALLPLLRALPPMRLTGGPRGEAGQHVLPPHESPQFPFQLGACAGVAWAGALLVAHALLRGALLGAVLPALVLLCAATVLLLRANASYATLTAALLAALYAAAVGASGARALAAGGWAGLLGSPVLMLLAVALCAVGARAREREARTAFLLLQLMDAHLGGLEEDGAGSARSRSSQELPSVPSAQSVQSVQSSGPKRVSSIAIARASRGSRSVSSAGGGVSPAPSSSRRASNVARWSMASSGPSSPSRSPHDGKRPKGSSAAPWKGLGSGGGGGGGSAAVTPIGDAADANGGGAAAAGGSGSGSARRERGGVVSLSCDRRDRCGAGSLSVDGAPPVIMEGEVAEEDAEDAVYVDLDSPIAKVQALLASIAENFMLSAEELSVIDEVRAALADSATSLWTPNLQSQLQGAQIDDDTRSWLFYEVAKMDTTIGVAQKEGAAPGAHAEGAGSASGGGSASARVHRGSTFRLLATAAEDDVPPGGAPAAVELPELLECSREQLAELLGARLGLGVPSSEVRELEEVRARMLTWEFDIGWAKGADARASAAASGLHEMHARYGSRLMRWMMLVAVESYGCLQRFAMPDAVFAQLLDTVERGYHDVPYHGLLHALDALHSMYWLLKAGGVDAELETAHIFAVLIGTLCHDIGHPGRNNTFLANTRSQLALLYNDKCVLENMHASTTVRLLSKPEFDAHVFGRLSLEEAKVMRDIVIDIIIGTDIAAHFENLGKYTAQQAKGLDLSRASDRNLHLSTLVHLADVANPTKTWGAYREWLPRLFQEFFEQGDEEVAKGLPVAPFMNRKVAAPAKAQLGFTQFIVQPLFEAVIESVPALEEKLEHIEHTLHFLNAWQEAGYRPAAEAAGSAAEAEGARQADAGRAAAEPLSRAELPDIYWDETQLTTTIAQSHVTIVAHRDSLPSAAAPTPPCGGAPPSCGSLVRQRMASVNISGSYNYQPRGAQHAPGSISMPRRAAGADGADEPQPSADGQEQRALGRQRATNAAPNAAPAPSAASSSLLTPAQKAMLANEAIRLRSASLEPAERARQLSEGSGSATTGTAPELQPSREGQPASPPAGDSEFDE